MRRLTAYITMSISILLAAGVSFVPSVMKMNADLDYGAAHEVVYNLTNKEDGSFVDTDEYIDDVAETMRARLDNYNIDSYSVVVEGTDSVRVKFAVENDTEYANVRDYLAFSGGDFSMATKEEESRRDHDTLFKDKVARIEYVNTIPYVVMPINDVSAMKSLIETAQSSHDDDDDEPTMNNRFHGVKRHEGEEEGSQADLFLWANWQEGDDFEKAEKDAGVTGKKIIAGFNSSNIWFKNGLKDDEEPTEIQYLCGYADDEGNYDVNKLEEANDLAVKLRNLLNASKYQDIEVKVTYEKNIDAVVDALVSPGKVNTSITLVATGVAALIMALLYVVFYRLGAVELIANNLTVSFLSLFFFLLLGATMNIAALVGLILVTLANAATGIYYMNKLKDFVYRGYSLKKSNQEALKKHALFTVDVSVVLLLSGLVLYLLAGNMLRSLAIALFFGGVLNLASNETIFRLLANFLTNSSYLQNKINLLNFDKNLIENAIEEAPKAEESVEAEAEAKPAKKNITRHAKPVAIFGGVLLLAGIVMSTIFGVKNKTIINTNSLTKDTTQVYLVLKYDESAVITLKNEDVFEENVLKNIKVNGQPLAYKAVEFGTRSDTDYETTVTTNYDYYVTSIDAVFTNEDTFAYVYEGVETVAYSIEEAIYGIAELVDPYVDTTNYLDYATKVSHETVINEPNFGWVSLACGISLIGAGLYFALRYRPSKALATTLIATGSTFSSIALFAITRIAATPVVYVIIPATMIIALVTSIFFMNKEKEMLNEVRTVDLTNEKRHEIMQDATTAVIPSLASFGIIAIYFGINYFGFGPSAYATFFGGFVIATSLTLLFVIRLLGPTGELFAKAFGKINLKRVKREKPKKQSKIKLQAKPKTSEPEETIFIGIND
ncbi:MAG: hypothetical protein MJ248_00265 [Bacilli bacterium]|nr:hypothetical protein [Bacilli bacterium]